jgi:hypothetical protein
MRAILSLAACTKSGKEDQGEGFTPASDGLMDPILVQ